MSLWHDALYKLTFYLLTWPDDTFTRVVWSFIGSCYVRLLFFLPNYLILFAFPAGNAECIGVASMGHCATLDFDLIFLVTSEPLKLSLFHWTPYVVA